MNLQQVTEILYKEPLYRQICRKIARSKDLADDLFQHIVLNVLEGKCKGIEEAATQGNLRWYFVRVCTNQYRSENTSTFSREMKHFEHVVEYLPIKDEEEECYDEEVDQAFEIEYQTVKEIIAERGWYEQKLFELALESKSIRQLSKQTKIPARSIYESIKKTKEYVHNRLNSTLPPFGQLEPNICFNDRQTDRI
jgi:DNA-directed RNA polymerase specialized sigma24 family protein